MLITSDSCHFTVSFRSRKFDLRYFDYHEVDFNIHVHTFNNNFICAEKIRY